MEAFDHKKYLLSILLVLSSVIFLARPAYSQIDNDYGLQKRGLRFGIGLGANTLISTWDKYSPSYTLVSSLSYDINPYFNFGVEGQYGKMIGQDNSNTFSFSRSENTYATVSFNLRFSIGLLGDFYSSNGFEDIIKRSYIGVGYGEVFSNLVLTSSGINNGGTTVTSQVGSSGVYKGTWNSDIIPFNLGTNIAMRGVWGEDKLEINPNIQYSIFKDAYVDGYQPRPTSTNGGYTLFSVSFRYKF